jgi:hypothetical protein
MIQTIVIFANIKLMILSNSHTALSLFLQLGSITVFYLQFLAEDYILKNDL